MPKAKPKTFFKKFWFLNWNLWNESRQNRNRDLCLKMNTPTETQSEVSHADETDENQFWNRKFFLNIRNQNLEFEIIETNAWPETGKSTIQY